MPKKKKVSCAGENVLPAPAELAAPVAGLENDSSKKKEKVSCIFLSDNAVTESSDSARELFNTNRYGALLEDGRVQLSVFEAMLLLEKGKTVMFDMKKKQLSPYSFKKKAKAIDKNFFVKYAVFKDLRNRGYTVKTALKFGADFRVYERGVKPGENHAKWIVYPVHEAANSTWYEFAAKNRVAHSTKKRLLIGIVDDEGDVTYYEIRWIRP